MFFFFNATAPPEIYTLSLHDALPISLQSRRARRQKPTASTRFWRPGCESVRSSLSSSRQDRKSTRLNSSHTVISYAVFCLKKKKKKKQKENKQRDKKKTSTLEVQRER